MADVQLGRLFMTLEGKDIGLTQMLTETKVLQDQVTSSAQSLSNQGKTTYSSLAAQLNELRTAANGNQDAFERLTAAASRDALAMGDAARAVQLMDAALGKETQEETINEQASLRMVQAQAQQLRQMGQLSAAYNLLSSELSKTTTQTIQTINAETQLINIQNQITKETDKSAQSFTKFTSGLQSGITSMIGPMALAAAAFSTLRSAAREMDEGFKLSAHLEQERNSIQLMLQGFRDSAQVLEGAQRFADKYRITQEDVTAAVSENIPVIQKSKSSIEDILGVFSRLVILKPDKTFQDAGRAIAELQSGNVVSLNRMFNIPLTEAHKMKTEIEKGGDAVQIVSKYLDRAGVSMAALENQTKGAAGKLREMAVESEKFQLAFSGGSGGLGLVILERRIDAVRGATRIFAGDLQGMGNSLDGFAAHSSSAFERLASLAGPSFAIWKQVALETEQVQQQMADAIVQANNKVTASINKAAVEDNALALARLHQTELTQQTTEAQTAYANSLEIAGVMERAAQQATEQKSQADQVAAIDAQTHKVALDALSQQAQIAANALLNSGAQGAASAAQLADSSSLVDVLTAAFYRLAAAQNAAHAANIQSRLDTTAPRTAGNDERDLAALKHSGLAQTQIDSKNAALAAAQAERDYQKELGNLGPSIDRVRADLAQLAKDQGPESAAYKRQLIAIHNLEQEEDAANKRRSGKHKAAGAGKLSDQQKFDNQGLAQQDKFNDDTEKRDRDHYRKLEDIQDSYNKKVLEQSNKNEIGKRTSRADFYENQIGDDKINAAKFNAQYEEAFAKSQQISQQGNKKLAQDYLDMRTQQIQKAEEYDKKEADIRDNKDLSRKEKQAQLDQLNAVRKLRDDVNREQEKQLLEGGDDINKENEKQLADENQRYQTAVDEASIKFDNLADNRIASYKRANKKISEEMPAEASQAIVANPGAPPVSTSTPVTSGGNPLLDAVTGQTNVLSSALDMVRKAVTDLGPKLDSIGRNIEKVKQGALT